MTYNFFIDLYFSGVFFKEFTITYFTNYYE